MDTIVQDNNSTLDLNKNKTEKVQLFIEPFKITNHIFEDGKFLISKYENEILDLKIIKKNTPLFNLIDKSSKNYNQESKLNETSLDAQLHEVLTEIDFTLYNINVTDNIGYSNLDGIFVHVNKIPKVIPIYYDIPFKINISKDSMIANIDFFPKNDDHPPLTLDEVLKGISKFGKVENIDYEIISNSIAIVTQKKEPLWKVCVAMGKYPINGKNGWLENLVEKQQNEKEIKEQVISHSAFNKDKSIMSVEENQIIAIIHDSVEGTDGSDIYGNPNYCNPAKEISVKLGTNVQYCNEDKNKICSKIDGFLEIYDNTMSINELLEVRGNIDVISGSISGYGSIKVSGNVINDMKLKLSNNVEIQGYVGDAQIDAGNDVTVKGGFLGNGNGIINAKGNIEIKFIENQKVFSRGSLTVTKETISSDLYARDKILSDGSQFTIIGGYAIASESITLYSVGNEYNTKTILEVGYDYEKKLALNNFSSKQISMKKELEIVDQEIIEISSMKRKSPQGKERIIFLANKHKEIFEEMDSMKKKRQQLFTEMNKPTKSKIVISNFIYPGVTIRINGQQRVITQRMKCKTFMLSKDNEIIAL